MAKKPPDRLKFAIQRLRQASRKWPPRFLKENQAKVVINDGFYLNGNIRTRVKYECASCHGLVDRRDKEMDHIEPVIDLTGFEDIHIYIERLLPYEDGWACLCKGCHRVKTKGENVVRVQKRKKKAKKKVDKKTKL